MMPVVDVGGFDYGRDTPAVKLLVTACLLALKLVQFLAGTLDYTYYLSGAQPSYR